MTGSLHSVNDEHTFLVAVVVAASDRETAELYLHTRLPDAESLDQAPGIECWWIAEDDRRDRSDNDSAVFVRYGTQAAGR